MTLSESESARTPSANRARWDALIGSARRRVAAGRAVDYFYRGALWALPALYLLCLFSALGLMAGRLPIVAAASITLLWWGATALRFLIPGSRRQALHALDRNLGLPDLALAGDEVGTRDPSEWGRSILDSALERLESTDWARDWPLSRARPAGALALVALPALVLLPFVSPSSFDADALETAETRDRNRERLVEMYEIWEQAAETFEEQWAEQEWNAFREYLEQAARELPSADEDPAQRDLLRQFHRMETRLDELNARLPATGLETFAGELANRARRMDGWESAASALESGHFHTASDRLQALSRNDTNGNSAEVPSLSDEDLERWEEMIEDLREAGHEELAEACELLCDGLKEGDAAKTAAALSRLAQLAQSEAFREQQQAALARMQRQLRDTREAMARGEQLARAEDPRRSPAMSPDRGDGEGDGIGSGTSDNPLGDPAAWTAEYFTETLEGRLSDEGESETRTISLEPSGPEHTGTGSTDARFDLYEQLSRETIDNEDIPLAHREAVRRYFQEIRPGTDEDDHD